MICSAWKDDGEQIQTASTSGWLITSSASAEKAGSLNLSAAASALATVGLEIITARALSHRDSASRCTRPIRPAPMMPTPSTPSSDSFMLTTERVAGCRGATARRSAQRPGARHSQSATQIKDTRIIDVCGKSSLREETSLITDRNRPDLPMLRACGTSWGDLPSV